MGDMTRTVDSTDLDLIRQGGELTQDPNSAFLDQVDVSIQADWACVWVRVEGPIAKNSIPVVISVVREVCGRTPRKLILLLQGSTYQPENLDDLLGQIAVLTRECGVKLVIQEAKARRLSRPRRWPRWGFPNRRTRWACTT
jgi:hypothetical protein